MTDLNKLKEEGIMVQSCGDVKDTDDFIEKLYSEIEERDRQLGEGLTKNFFRKECLRMNAEISKLKKQLEANHVR